MYLERSSLCGIDNEKLSHKVFTVSWHVIWNAIFTLQNPFFQLLAHTHIHTTVVRTAESHHLMKFYHRRHQNQLLLYLETLRNCCSGIFMGLMFFLMPKMIFTVRLSMSMDYMEHRQRTEGKFQLLQQITLYKHAICSFNNASPCSQVQLVALRNIYWRLTTSCALDYTHAPQCALKTENAAESCMKLYRNF